MISTLACPSCQRTLRVPESLLGQAVKCPTCSHIFTAPESVEEAPRRPVPVPESPSTYPVQPLDDDYDEPRPSQRRVRAEDYDEDYDDEPRPSRRRRRGSDRPSKVQAIGIMVLIGGIFATLAGVLFMITIYGLCWPGTYYSLVMGIMAILKGSALLGQNADRQPSPNGIGIMMIINVINCDAVNLALGIVVLVFLNDEEVKDYFR
jgi:predicted Zn finger-like uncharacterized protein